MATKAHSRRLDDYRDGNSPLEREKKRLKKMVGGVFDYWGKEKAKRPGFMGEGNMSDQYNTMDGHRQAVLGELSHMGRGSATQDMLIESIDRMVDGKEGETRDFIRWHLGQLKKAANKALAGIEEAEGLVREGPLKGYEEKDLARLTGEMKAPALHLRARIEEVEWEL